MLGLLLLGGGGHPAGAATLPTLPSTVSKTVASAVPVLNDVTTDTSSVTNVMDNPNPPTIASLVNGAGGVIPPVGKPFSPVLPVNPVLPGSPGSALLPVPTLPGSVARESLTTAASTAPSLGTNGGTVVSGIGIAPLVSLRSRSQSALSATPASPFVPSPSPGGPSVPQLPFVTVGSSSTSGSGLHGLSLDSLPPTIGVLALLVAAGIGLERQRRPKTRFDLRFSPPG